MSDKPSSPFAGLDKALLRSTRQTPPPQEQHDTQLPADTAQAQMPANQQASIPETQQAGNMENKQAGKTAIQQTGKQESRKAGVPASQTTSTSPTLQKVTYRLSPGTIDAIEDVKLLLRRQYKIKASLEEIADVVIYEACREMLENPKKSMLVNKFAGKPANKKSSK